jgi:hypothetical protein
MPSTPPAVGGRKHMEIQTENFLEELTDNVPEVDEETQTDFYMDRCKTVQKTTSIVLSLVRVEGTVEGCGRSSGLFVLLWCFGGAFHNFSPCHCIAFISVSFVPLVPPHLLFLAPTLLTRSPLLLLFAVSK